MAIFDSLRYTIFGDSKEIKLGDKGNIDIAKRGHLAFELKVELGD
jgi:hypothetical protein